MLDHVFVSKIIEISPKIDYLKFHSNPTEADVIFFVIWQTDIRISISHVT